MKRENKNDLTAETARELLRYEPDTGKLYWRERARKWCKSDREHGRWNTRYAGKEAWTNLVDGYPQGPLLGFTYKAHRVIWLMQTGSWPADEIDHINRVRNDNRWENLRQVTHRENAMNTSIPKRNTSGVKGVHWCKHKNKYVSRIRVKYKLIHLGVFETLEEAAASRSAAESRYGYV